MSNLSKILLGLSLIFAFLVPVFNIADAQISCNVDWPTIPGAPNLNDICRGVGTISIGQLVLFLFTAALWVGGIIAFVALVYAGFMYVFSGASPSSRERANKMVQNVFWGLLILLTSVVALRLINPDITTLRDPTLRIDPAETPGDIGLGDPAIPGPPTVGDPGVSQPSPPLPPANPTCRERCIEQWGNDRHLFCLALPRCATYDEFARLTRSMVTPANDIRHGNRTPSYSTPHWKYINTLPTDHKGGDARSCYGADCGVFVATVVRNTIDPNFPLRGTWIMFSYLSRNTNFTKIPITSTMNLMPGDILLTDGKGHISIWLDDGEYEAAWSDRGCSRSQMPHGPEPRIGRNMDYIFRYNGFR